MKIAKSKPFEGKPVIHMPSVYGACTGKEIIRRIPVTGKRPIQIQVTDLPKGLKLENGIITGVIDNDCEFPVRITAENELGKETCEVTFKIHEDTMLLTPLLGFTSWNAFGSAVSQEKVEAVAQEMLQRGIMDYGYHYINIDSGWQKEYGGEFDAIMPNEKFPDMHGFCERMHALGLKCGIYSTPMLTAWGCPEELPSIPGCTRGEPSILFTCNNGGIGDERLEENNVRQWEQWGFDYVKYDWAPCEPINADYMKKAILKAKREMAFCVTVNADIRYREYWKRKCCSWRCNQDSMDKWDTLKDYLADHGYCKIEYWKEAVSPGHYYDLDMLEIGSMSWNQGKSRLTENEEIFAYTLRAFFLSPIQLSCVISDLTEFEFNLITNDEIIRMNQDSLADFPEPYSKNEPEGVLTYRRTLENGDTAFAIFNTADEEKTQRIPLGEFSSVRNLWTKTDLTPGKEFTCTVESHCAVVLRASK